MKGIGLHAGLLAVLFLMSSGSATATIDAIESDACTNGCLRSAVQPVVRGKISTMTVRGQFVDLSTAVEVSPADSRIIVSYGTRTGGSNSSIVIRFDVRDGAPLGERTIKMRYLVETSGPDTFTIRVVRGGTVEKIEYVEPQRDRLGNLAGERVTAPTALPVNRTVKLRFTGSNIGNASLSTGSTDVRNVRKLDGCTETRCDFEMEFARSGNFVLVLYDAATGFTSHSTILRFNYAGANSVTVAASPPTTDATPCVSDPTPPPVPKTSPENNATVTIDNNTDLASVTFTWSLESLTAAQRSGEKLVFKLEDGRTPTSTELSPGTTRRTINLTRGRTYKWNVFIKNCGTPPPANNISFAPFTVTVNP